MVNIPVAEKVVITPVENIIIKIQSPLLKNILNGKSVKKGDKIKFKKKDDTDEFYDVEKNQFKKSKKKFDDILNLLDEGLYDFGLGDIIFEVVETVPDGKVKINKNTKIVLDNYGNEDNIILVKTKPNLKNMFEVSDKKEWSKVEHNRLVNCYSDKKEKIYFVEDWYYIEKND